eukprot:CAMPEP_0206059012 /NCGR_PEP_ID=MMETSP1466-20131121/48004_1 /ASSEMBLY_ACC=CAM_ASM_001126 /TAXON_ID=44452 /ORGANISM="Pavlova gyrans, Strain CCMP608" /LENGTH=70 /DNA_ID=CAMNT_0053434323 /DNA_START=37 /DNA_END=249 /DNA_ORIENTATION=+
MIVNPQRYQNDMMLSVLQGGDVRCRSGLTAAHRGRGGHRGSSPSESARSVRRPASQVCLALPAALPDPRK